MNKQKNKMKLTVSEYAELYGCNASYVYRQCAANKPMLGIKKIAKHGIAYVLNMHKDYEEKINMKKSLK